MQLCFHCITGTTNPTHSTCHYDASQKDHVEARVAAATPRRRRPAPSARIHRCRCRISTICNSRRPRRRTIRNSITRPSSTCAPRSPMCPLSRWRRWSMRRHEGTMRSPTNRRTPLDHTWNRKRIIGQTKLWDEKNAIFIRDDHTRMPLCMRSSTYMHDNITHLPHAHGQTLSMRCYCRWQKEHTIYT